MTIYKRASFLMRSTTNSNNVDGAGYALTLAQRTGGTSDHVLDGYLDEVTLWNRALSASELLYLMKIRLRGDEPGLVGYWSMDEGAGSIINDKSNCKTHGILTSATWVAR